ncbi:CpsD/CapB family tyrosine-protein kinase [Pikeienuella piscinae]|uniref:CpsD/CapB family tyrosine-protein kinase n=1 Tax=Pikeienuella piscinae TaxID=2748098 RepID=A0A7M3T6K7_9RHOB|nr:CpsD/CapB family tyrosine-protein kinase [Pikeienuella piscinae]QIE57638.1 CpsD/CapB family tyrosine-protein kinase [Pikeienuella piscinae]
MVERLKHAIEKARALREAQAAEQPAAGVAAAPRPSSPAASAPAGSSAAVSETDAFWSSLRELELRPERLHRSRIVTHDKSDLAHIPFDLLRTRLMKVLRDNGWRRVAITSPTKGCGKTLVAANLAFSLARQPDYRTLLIDMDLKAPEMARILGQKEASPLAWLLSGRTQPEAALMRVGMNLALGLNGERVRDSTEMIQDEKTVSLLASITERLDPDVVIYDLPPLLVSDDAIAFVQHVDCVLLVAAAGQTTAKDIESCERMFAGQVNFLGVLLNKAEDGVNRKAYEYA